MVPFAAILLALLASSTAGRASSPAQREPAGARAAPQREARGAPEPAPQRPRPSGAQGPQGAPGDPALESAKRRWERLSPEEQALARERYERYLSLSEGERRALDERARRLDELRERVLAELPEAARRRLAALDPEKRRELVAELVESRAREIGAGLRGALPPETLERLERASPEDRARFFAQLDARDAERMSRAIEDLGAKLALSPEERARIEALPPPERRARMLELKQRWTIAEHERQGLPGWLAPETWERFKALPPEAFFDELARVRREHAGIEGLGRGTDEPGPPQGPRGQGPRREGAGPIGARPDGPRPEGARPEGPRQEGVRPEGPRSGAPPREGPPPDGRPPRGGAGPEEATPEERRLRREVGEALRLRPDDLLDHADLAPPERRMRVEERRRERVLGVLRANAALRPERLAELERMPPRRFFEELRRLLGPAPQGGPPRPR